MHHADTSAIHIQPWECEPLSTPSAKTASMTHAAKAIGVSFEMSLLGKIRRLVFVPGETLESADRRALLLGAAVTSAGLLVPRAIISIPKLIVAPMRVMNATTGALFATVRDALGSVKPGEHIIIQPRHSEIVEVADPWAIDKPGLTISGGQFEPRRNVDYLVVGLPSDHYLRSP